MKNKRTIRSVGKNSSNSQVVRVGLTQMGCSADPDKNLARQLELLERAAKQGENPLHAGTVSVPVFLSGGGSSLLKLAERSPDEHRALGKIAKKHKA